MAILLFVSCGSEQEGASTAPVTGPDTNFHVMDPHSAARPEEAVIQHLDLDIRVDMDSERIAGTATYTLKSGHADQVIFDTDSLDIESVELPDGKPLEYALSHAGLLGSPLTVQIPKDADKLTIRYATTKGARALQWLSPRQTHDKQKPFLFTQGEAILTRTWIPIQDSPGIRFTYNAHVQVPKDLLAVMSATNPQERSADGKYSFTMDKPIPAYLMALAVGDIAFKPVGPRTGVYAEPGVVDTAAWELADMEHMVEAAEKLYGPYRWDRYDVLVLPPSFPFGGMENPRLTFATPTILAGDRSLTALVAHELAHSWSGNLVTNATWNDFWLNEGFTVYFEKRICEQLYGKEYASMLALLGYQDLKGTVAKLDAAGDSADTRLKLDLTGRDPDDGMTDVAYEKGYSFLKRLETAAGREKFDAFLRGYFDHFAFQGMTTERFLDYLNAKLIQPEHLQVDVHQWVYEPGIPKDLVMPTSDAFAKVEHELDRWKNGTPARDLDTRDWVTFQWMHFLRHLPEGLSDKKMDDLDNTFQFTRSGNSEVVAVWLEQCVKNDHEQAYDRLDSFLTTVGRRKFLTPLYEALIKTEKGKALAMNIYKAARPNYHAVSVRTIDDLLNWKQMSDPVTL